ncbi:MAG TPA: DUF4390 domain-containing protein [Spirochaetes bacterium]|nr:DUF4390 domain-containing protein [Spirochaetota bacterium]
MKKSLYLYLLSSILVLFSASSVNANKLTVIFNENIYKDDLFQSDLSISGDISYDTIEAIQNGITANMFVTFQLLRSNSLFAQGRNLKGEKVYSFTISYDVWENSFIIINDKNTYYVDKSSDIIGKINEIISPLSIRVEPDHEKEKVIFRARIKIETIKLYPPLGIFLIFFDPWNYQSGWINTDVFTLEKS